MTVRILFLIVVFTASHFPAISQSSSSDSLKNFTIKLIERGIKKSKIKKIAVWDFTDMNKENSTFGSHIAELISVYATFVDSIIVMDRQNLKSLLKEHKLKSEGFIDPATVMELGRFSGVDAVIVGDAIVAGKDFEVIIKILETNQAGTIAADDQFFPIDDKMAAKLGIQISETEVKNTNNPNKGFNRPLNSNEQFNNSGTVSRECEKKNTGDYCFYYSGLENIMVFVYKKELNNDNPPEIARFSLKEKESKCIYNIPAGSYFFMVMLNNSSYGQDSGDFLIEKCKSKTYNIK
jgi:hypothetical protein